jgi:hypothetical protein
MINDMNLAKNSEKRCLSSKSYWLYLSRFSLGAKFDSRRKHQDYLAGQRQADEKTKDWFA